MPLILENLPNELLLFIFNHLSVINLLQSFYRLNRRFSNLIQTIPHLHVDFSSHALSKTQFIYTLNQLRSLNIESIRLSTRYYIDVAPLFSSYIPTSQLIHLRSLALIDADRMTIEKLLHNYPQLTSLTIESSVWRSIPRHCLPHFSNLTHCHLPTLDFLKDCHLQIIDLTLDNCTTDNLLQFHTCVPNLHSLTLTLTNSTIIPPLLQFPRHLSSLKLTLRSILFTDFERLILMIEHLQNLTVSFSNTEHEVHCFDQYLFGDYWHSISNYVKNLQLNITVHRTLEAFSSVDLIFSFDWYQRKIICQAMDDTNGYHLYSLPYIDKIYTTNFNNDQEYLFDSKDFDRVDQLRLMIPNGDIQSSSNCVYRNLQMLTVIVPTVNQSIIPYIDHLMTHSHLRTLELRFISVTDQCRDYFNQLIFRLPSSIEMLILNTTSTRFLSDVLDGNHQLLSNLKRLSCSIKNRDDFDTLILLLLEIFQQKSLIYLNIALEHSSRSSNFLPGWLLKTNYLKKARIKCSERQCAIWI